MDMLIRLVYCCTRHMAHSPILPYKVNLSFKSLTDLAAFKNECGCNDFYIDRDELTLVGSFTEGQLKIATDKYRALYYSDTPIHNPKLGL
jgi:hypothetical protein